MNEVLDDVLIQFGVHQPSGEAGKSLAETRRYNEWIGKQKDWEKAAATPAGQARNQKQQEALGRVHQRAIDNRGILPFGKKAKERRRYSKDMDWINSQLRADAMG